MVRALVFALVLALSATGCGQDQYSDCNQEKDPDRQIRGCTQVIERGKRESKSTRAKAYYNRGNAYDDKGEVDIAIADFTKAIALNPNYALAYNNRGNAYGRKGDYDRAIADFGRAIKLNPKDADAYNNRGLAYDDKGNKEKAIADYRKVLEIDPSNQVGKDGLKRLGVTP